MSLERAYELADQYTDKTGGYTQIRIERWNFNHKENNDIKITYHFSAQGLDPIWFDSMDELICFLEGLLK